jgi:TldD protein
MILKQEQDYNAIVEEHLLKPSNLSLSKLNDALLNFNKKEIDFGDMYFQRIISEGWVLEDNIVKSGSFCINQGVGVRGVRNGDVGFSYSDDLRLSTIIRLTEEALYLLKDTKIKKIPPKKLFHNVQRLYSTDSPLESLDSEKKIGLLKQVNAYARKKDSRIRKVSISLNSSYEVILLMDTTGICMMDVRPLVCMRVNIMMEDRQRYESFSSGGGRRSGYEYFINEDLWKSYVEEAYAGAKSNLYSKNAPSGTMPVILGSGWPAVLLHEAVGHGLEGDFNRKKTSHFTDKIGQKVASSKCTIIDEGCLPGRRGSLTFDDEGIATQKTILIEKGILKGYIHDRISAQAMNQNPTGNGRRESYAHLPLPRMTNTYMMPGEDKVDDMISSIDYGIYATHFNGGQVDITSGQFVFVTDRAYLIEKGKVTSSIKGASLIGHGPEVMQGISMVGPDFSLDKGVGLCGKNGQIVPVGVGQATLKIDSITVGGTKR